MELNYHIHTSNIKCPYCDKEYFDCYEDVGEIETRVELECEYCNKKFYADSCIVFNTYADCELNGKEHDLVETHIKGFFACKACEYYGKEGEK